MKLYVGEDEHGDPYLLTVEEAHEYGRPEGMVSITAPAWRWRLYRRLLGRVRRHKDRILDRGGYVRGDHCRTEPCSEFTSHWDEELDRCEECGWISRYHEGRA